MDYVDFIVHVFSAEKRAFYGLERLRKSATTISVADLDAEVSQRIAQTRAKSPKKATPVKASAVKKSASAKGVAKKAPAKKVAAKKSVAKSASAGQRRPR